MLKRTIVPISVVIPTLNRPQTLKTTLESMLSVNTVPAQLIIVDQSQQDSLRKETQKVSDRYAGTIDVQYIFQETPSSTKARNKGMEYANQPVIVFCDDDVKVKSNTFSEVATIMSDSAISMIAGIDLNEGLGSSLLGYIFGRKSYINRNIGHVTLSIYGRFPSQKILGEVPTQWAMGFFFCVKRENLYRWNIRWDERLTSYAYAEDLDFSYSYYKNSCKEGLKCILTPRVAVYHMHSREWRVSSYKSVAMSVINREYLSYKHFSWQSRVATRWANIGEFLLKLVRHDNPMYIIYAQMQCDIHRNELKEGCISPDLYDYEKAMRKQGKE